MRMTMTFEELSDRFGMSDEVCDALGLNPYCLKEGMADYDDTVDITLKQALKIGISKHEFNARAN